MINILSTIPSYGVVASTSLPHQWFRFRVRTMESSTATVNKKLLCLFFFSNAETGDEEEPVDGLPGSRLRGLGIHHHADEG